MAAKGFSILTALALLMTLPVIIPNYGTGTIQTMQFLSVQQSQHILSPKACKTKIISQFNRILQWSPWNFTHRLQSDPKMNPTPSLQVWVKSKLCCDPFQRKGSETNKGKKWLLGSDAGAHTSEEGTHDFLIEHCLKKIWLIWTISSPPIPQSEKKHNEFYIWAGGFFVLNFLDLEGNFGTEKNETSTLDLFISTEECNWATFCLVVCQILSKNIKPFHIPN